MTQACLKGNKTREKEGSFKDHAHFYRLTMKLPIFCHRLCKSEGFLTNYPQAKTQKLQKIYLLVPMILKFLKSCIPTVLRNTVCISKNQNDRKYQKFKKYIAKSKLQTGHCKKDRKYSIP